MNEHTENPLGLTEEEQETRTRARLLAMYLEQPDRDRSAILADAELLSLSCENFIFQYNPLLMFRSDPLIAFTEIIYYIGYSRGLETGKLEAAYPEEEK